MLLGQGLIAYFSGDYDTARQVAEESRLRVLAGEKNWRALDLVSLQGLIAHLDGEWFDRIRYELRTASLTPDISNALFDGYLCPAEYLLYGSTPYDEVIQLARTIQKTGEKSGALRAVAFARALVGESALLSGDLALASVELAEAADLHHALGSAGGEAHCLTRLAEVRIAEGDPEAARRLLDQALPLARWSTIAMHLMHRIYGLMITAAPDPTSARAVVDRAEATIGSDDACQFCGIMLALPAMMACAHSGDLDRARYYRGSPSSRRSYGTEPHGVRRSTRPRRTWRSPRGADPDTYLESAAAGFERAGQPIDVIAGLGPAARAGHNPVGQGAKCHVETLPATFLGPGRAREGAARSMGASPSSERLPHVSTRLRRAHRSRSRTSSAAIRRPRAAPAPHCG